MRLQNILPFSKHYLYGDPCVSRPHLQPQNFGLKLEVVLKWRDIYIQNIRMVSMMAGLKMEGFVKGVLNHRDHRVIFILIFFLGGGPFKSFLVSHSSLLLRHYRCRVHPLYTATLHNILRYYNEATADYTLPFKTTPAVRPSVL